jgi:branched-chain amino acid transport system ATP-binding protein
MSSTVLSVRGLEAGYAGGRVLQGVDLELAEGATLALLGRNGAGKTTLLSAVMGMLRPYSGSVRLDGRELGRCRPDVVCRAGLAIVPQGRRVFAPLTVEENLQIAVRRSRPGRWDVDAVYALLPRLHERRANRGDQLSGGEQQMLAIARALLANPRVLLLDEPSDGLAPSVVEHIFDVLETLAQDGLSILVVEQNLRAAFRLADEIAVLQKGSIVLRCGTDQFRGNQTTARQLLGVG